MARHRRRQPPPDLASAKSWEKKWVKDAYENTFGLVTKVSETKEGIRLFARFPGEKRERKIALEVTADRNFLDPAEVKARYRPASLEEVKLALAAK